MSLLSAAPDPLNPPIDRPKGGGWDPSLKGDTFFKFPNFYFGTSR